MKKNAVCIVTPHFPGPMHCGGIGTAVYWQALALAEAGIQVTVFYTGHIYIETPAYWAQKLKKEHGIEFVGAADWIHKNRTQLRTRKYAPQFDELIYAQWVFEFLQTRNFEVVYLQDYQGHGIRALQAKKAGIAFGQTQFVLTLHGSTEWGFENLELFTTNPELLVVEFQEKESARLADHLIAPSAYMKQWVVERWRLDAKRITVVPYCFEDPAKGPVTQNFGPFDHLVFLGRLETRKGLEIFTEAIMGSALLKKKIKKVSYLGQSGWASGLLGRPWLETVGLKGAPFKYEILEKFNTFQAWEWIHAQKNILVAAPSLMDNLPLAVIEPFLRRVPFVTTDVGGIPEIVGQNPEVLMQATVEGVRERLEKIMSSGSLKIRYTTGMQPAKTRAQNVAFHKKICREFKPAAEKAMKMSSKPQMSVILAHESDTRGLRRGLETLKAQKGDVNYEVIVADQNELGTPGQKSFERLAREYRSDQRFQFISWGEKVSTNMAYNEAIKQASGEYVVFFDAACEAYPDFVASYYQGMQTSGADAMTGFFESIAEKTAGLLQSQNILQLHTPVGAAVEAGLFKNFFGQACWAVRRDVFRRLGGFSIASALYKKFPTGEWTWDFLAKLALAGKQLTVMPKVLFRYRGSPEMTPTLWQQHKFKNRSIIFERYATAQAHKSVDWKRVFALFEGNAAASTQTVDTTPELYHYFAKLSDEKLQVAIGKKKGSENDATIAQMRKTLAPLLKEWQTTRPRVYIYGAGQHTRVLLGAVPELAKYVTGVIDRAADAGQFLGWARVTPEKFKAKDCDAVVYSSKESELAMYKNICQHEIEHVLLYNKIPVKC